jgi:hypothetical protein
MVVMIGATRDGIEVTAARVSKPQANWQSMELHCSYGNVSVEAALRLRQAAADLALLRCRHRRCCRRRAAVCLLVVALLSAVRSNSPSYIGKESAMICW